MMGASKEPCHLQVAVLASSALPTWQPTQTQQSAHTTPKQCIFLSGHQGVCVDRGMF